MKKKKKVKNNLEKKDLKVKVNEMNKENSTDKNKCSDSFKNINIQEKPLHDKKKLVNEIEDKNKLDIESIFNQETSEKILNKEA